MCNSKPKVEYTEPVIPAAPAAPAAPTGEVQQQAALDSEGTQKKKRSAGKKSLMIKPQSTGMGVNI